VQAIEAMRTYEWSVTSLQEHAAALMASKAADARAAAAQVAQHA
jgi:carbamoyl-phosphate synthase large subunit